MAKIPFDINVMLDHPEWRVEDENGVEITLISDLIQHRNGYGSDLFIITPEPELTEFEKKLSDVVGYAISLSVAKPQKPTSEFVKEYAAELLALARKQLIEEQYTSDPRKTDLYKLGKAEALKDLPRWRHAYTTCSEGKGKPTNPESAYLDDDFLIILPQNSNEAKCILLDDLKKLPGFKED